MARSPYGILGSFFGKVGTVVGRELNGQDIISIKPKKRKKNAARYKKKGSLVQQKKISLMSTFLTQLKEVIKISFTRSKAKAAPISYAMKYNLKHALRSTDEGQEIDFPALRFSEGRREPAWSEDITFEAGRKVKISWEIPDTVDRKLFGKDLVYIILYQIELEKFLTFREKAIRSDLEYEYTAHEDQVGHTLHGWIFFISPDGKEVSDSDYLGSGILLT